MFRHSIACVLVVALVAFPAFPSNAWGWGAEGHVIVAKIAELRLTKGARQRIAAILGTQSIADNGVANWPDSIRHNNHFLQKYPNNPSWHFVDIPFDASAFDPTRDCGAGNCVIDRIGAFSKIAADATASHIDQREAVAFVVHFVGDIHQPLHCAQRANDRGGNQLLVTYRGQSDPHLNLHAVWDTNLVHEVMAHVSPEDAAHRLAADIDPDDAARWMTGSIADWGWEAHKLAVSRAYRAADGTVLPIDGVPDLDDDYIAEGKVVVKLQLQRAGVRLANLLNTTFKDGQ